MSPIHGADPEDLDALARSFEATADRLLDLLSDSRTLAERASWAGPDAESFRRHIGDDLGAAVNRASDSVRRAAEDLRRNANEQRAASEPGSSISPGSGTTAASAPGFAVASSSFFDPGSVHGTAGSIGDVVRGAGAPPPDWHESPRVAALIDLVGPRDPVPGTVSLGEVVDAQDAAAPALLTNEAVPSEPGRWAAELFGLR